MRLEKSIRNVTVEPALSNDATKMIDNIAPQPVDEGSNISVTYYELLRHETSNESEARLTNCNLCQQEPIQTLGY